MSRMDDIKEINGHAKDLEIKLGKLSAAVVEDFIKKFNDLDNFIKRSSLSQKKDIVLDFDCFSVKWLPKTQTFNVVITSKGVDVYSPD
jgi:hypothetical protein